ncbi:CoA transferase [Pseudoxanthomonas broegbernensis]|uniref:CoA transferase n=1 Tax=Pseudoxanthomonas broegbernensis TaxID=83619 RepID=A0A7V8GMZ3_9GAMM|nr:CoA transferase [Pseudoxanthomonas broegbernensis]KAF1686723.1 CoA transferase [Pseudoxanthomonas broegbernensis]MBB6063510.1 crotonobetainyl-CoA:carnitine CoA-transferase CaiB-like acyl-CoA transferase [Pseudoxanthomonas broegbernensis]
MGPLNGIRVVDLTTVLMGPYATQVLAQMGADVIKVEAPEGDVIRHVGPERNPGMGALFLNSNRGKRSLCLDLKRPQAREALLAVLREADVLVHNLRPQALARLGLDHASLAGAYPRLLHVGLTGFGQDGPYAGRPAYDDLIQGASGLSAWMATAGDGTPRYVPTALADRMVGLAAVGAICAGLLHRERSGRGQQVEVPMFETMAALVLSDHLGGQTFQPPLPGEGYRRLLSPYRRPYRTRDGHVCALVYTDRHWQCFLDALGLGDLPVHDRRFASFASRTAHIDHVYAFLQERFRERTTAQWLELLERIDVPAMPMHDLAGVLADPHLAATGFFQEIEHPSEGRLRATAPPVRWSDTPAPDVRPAPRQGADGIEVLREAGLAEEAIGALLASDALRLPPGRARPEG